MKPPHLAAQWVLLLVALSYVEIVRSQTVRYRSLLTCSGLHVACTACSVAATTTAGQVTLCNACAGPSYVVSLNQRTCNCAPGYYFSTSPIGAVAACVLCPKGSFCPGGPQQTATSIICGPGLTTISTGAMTAASCITMPGTAFMHGTGTAEPCRMGTYNDGWNKRNCTSCPVGMSTASTGASSFGSCLALPGWFYQNRIALPCAQGTYKPSLGQAVRCLKCPSGSTTHSIRHTAGADCSVALPGYQITWVDDDTPHVEPCPHSSYSPGYSTQPCRPCPLGLTTPSTGSTTVSDCSAPPGHGFYCPSGSPAGSGPVTSSMLQQLGSPCVMPCPQGSYKAGWGREPCVSCGVNFRSPGQAMSAQQCYIPAGWGSKQSWKEGGLVATKCMRGMYGASQPVYGTTRKRPCQPCPQHTITPDMLPAVTVLQGQQAAAALDAILLTSAQQCLTVPGYGWQAGRATRCGLGFYAPGYSREPCTACGPGMTTEAMGSQAKAACVARPERQLTGVGTAEPCPSGTWSSGGMAKCKACYKSLEVDLASTIELTSTIEESSNPTEPITLDDVSWSDGLSELEAAAAKPHRDGQCMMT